MVTGSVYSERAINLKTGVLGNDNRFLNVGESERVALGKVIVEQYVNSANTAESYLNVSSSAPGHRRLIQCTGTMLSSCATASNVQLDPSDRYLILTDPATEFVHVALIDLRAGTITDTGSGIPMTAQTPGFVFSPDANILYGVLAIDHSIHFYHFNRASGALSEGGTPIMLSSGAGICPAQRH
jgi:hypothetical protein